MRQLTGRDAGFLVADSANASANANVSLLHIFDQATVAGGVLRFKTVLAHIERRLSAAPLFRQRLQRVPLGLGHPYWVDDPHFDLEYHVRHIALPKPGDWRQFCIQTSRIHARALDFERPLWEAYVIEGLDSFLDLAEGSVALLLKTHLAAVGLQQLSHISALLLDSSAHPPADGPPVPWFADAVPGRLALLGRSLVQAAAQTVKQPASAPLRLALPLAHAAARVAPAAAALAGEWLLRPPPLPATRFNSALSPHRVFETRRFTEAEFDQVRGLVPGATLDDAVLTVCGGALRRYLDAQGELPEQQSLLAIMPLPAPPVRVDQRAGDPISDPNGDPNRDPNGDPNGDQNGAREGAPPGSRPPPAWRARPLGTQIADPLQRLAAIRAAAVAAADAPLPALSWARRLAGRAGAHLAPHAPAGHVSITRLPAPAQPLYLCGARMTYFSAILPISDGLGLAFAVTRYDGRVVISPTSCRELMPDPELFALCLRDSFQEYLALALARGVAVKKLAAPGRRAARKGI